MWDPQYFATLYAFTALYVDTSTFTFFVISLMDVGFFGLWVSAPAEGVDAWN
jgi:hypothetical protein